MRPLNTTLLTSAQSILPSALNHVVGTLILCGDFAARYPACMYLYQRPACALASACV